MTLEEIKSAREWVKLWLHELSLMDDKGDIILTISESLNISQAAIAAAPQSKLAEVIGDEDMV